MMTMSDGPDHWSVAAAKSRFSHLLARAAERPQVIERRGKPVAVVVGSADFERVGDARTGALYAARLSKFLDLSARLRSDGGAELELPARERRASPFARGR